MKTTDRGHQRIHCRGVLTLDELEISHGNVLVESGNEVVGVDWLDIELVSAGIVRSDSDGLE
jgi:hypothetical protein